MPMTDGTLGYSPDLSRIEPDFTNIKKAAARGRRKPYSEFNMVGDLLSRVAGGRLHNVPRHAQSRWCVFC
jgi:hypothetical protein